MVDKASKIHELRSAFDAYNVNRVFTATLNFSGNQNNFFRVIPYLLHCSSDILNCSPTVPHGICSFTPKKIHTDAFKKLFPEAKQFNANKSENCILSLSLIGSIGTVAQTAKSDFDYIALIDKKKFSDKGFEELSKKLSAIEKWAMGEMKIEVHFFLQDIAEFRKNHFGMTDEESAGSAGGKLLKDEYYRTAIIIAGKKPLWWIIPVGMQEKEVEGFKKELPSLIGDKSNEYVDMGHILHIEPQEFFGAALWHMNKFLNSPYKSLLKMALLESYLFNPEDPLLCEKIKISVLEPGKEGRVQDPYIMMCERVTDDYKKIGLPEKDLRVVQAAFLLKTGLTPDELRELIDKPMADLDDKEGIVAWLLKKWNWSRDDFNLLGENILGRDSSFQLSEKVSSFLLNAYKRVSDWLQQSGIKANLITKDDLTVLGRKLFTFFDKKPGKIPFLLPGQTPKEPPECITIVYDKFPGKATKWHLFSFHFFGINTDNLKNIAPPIVTLSSVIEVLVWAVINRLWKPGRRMVFEGKVSHLKQKDMEKAMAGLFAFLIGDSYNFVRNDYLSEKRIVKAFAIINFGAKESSNNLSNVDLVLLNSWGEFFINRLEPEQAEEKIAEMIVAAKQSKKDLNMEIVAPSQKNHSMLCKKFENLVDMAVEIKADKNEMKTKKARLDTFT